MPFKVGASSPYTDKFTQDMLFDSVVQLEKLVGNELCNSEDILALKNKNKNKFILVKDNGEVCCVGIFRKNFETFKGLCGLTDHTDETYVKSRLLSLVTMARGRSHSYSNTNIRLFQRIVAVIRKLPNMPHLYAGTGLHRFVNGDVFQGSLNENGRPQHFGIYRSNNGYIYEGRFDDGVFSRGRVINAVTLKDKKEFKNFFATENNLDVFKEFIIKNGDKSTWIYDGPLIEGDVLEGKMPIRQGKGTCIWGDGSEYTGEFLDDEIRGKNS